jgi:colicin import membrane protein
MRMHTRVLLLCWVAATASLDVAILSPDEGMNEYNQAENSLVADRDKDQAALSADAGELRRAENALRETKSEKRSDQLKQHRVAESVKRLTARKDDKQRRLDQSKADAKHLRAVVGRKQKAVDAASIKQDEVKKKLTAISQQLKAQDEVVESTTAAFQHQQSKVDEARGHLKKSRAKVRELRTSMGLATDHLDAAAAAMANAEASEKQAHLDLAKRAEQLKQDRLAEAKVEAALNAAEMKAAEDQKSIDQAILVQKAEAHALSDRMKSAAAAEKAAATQAKNAEASRRIAQTLEESLGLADGEQLTVAQLGAHIQQETDKIMQLRENVTSLERDLRIVNREKAMADKEGASAADHAKAQLEKVKQEELSLEDSKKLVQTLANTLDEAQPRADDAVRAEKSAHEQLKRAKQKQDTATAKRKQAEQKIHSTVQANIPPGVSIDKAQQMLRRAQQRVKTARGELHRAIEAEHDALDETQKAQTVAKKDRENSGKLIKHVASIKLQLGSAQQGVHRLQGKIEGDTNSEGDLHSETNLMLSRATKVGKEAAAFASKLQQTKEELATAEQRLAQMKDKQKQLSIKIQAELKQAEPSKMFGPAGTGSQVQNVQAALSPEQQQKMKSMINQTAEASTANNKAHKAAEKSAADEIAEEQSKIKTPADLKKFKAELKKKQEESAAKRAAQEEERKEQAALAAADSKEKLELMKAKQAELEAEAQQEASYAANAAKKAAKAERANAVAEAEITHP